MHELTLYFKPTCPYCQKVIDYLELNKMSINMKNVNESSEIREELIKIGGKGQVPCLIVDGKAMYESDDIIQWLNTNCQDNEGIMDK